MCVMLHIFSCIRKQSIISLRGSLSVVHRVQMENGFPVPFFPPSVSQWPVTVCLTDRLHLNTTRSKHVWPPLALYEISLARPLVECEIHTIRPNQSAREGGCASATNALMTATNSIHPSSYLPRTQRCRVRLLSISSARRAKLGDTSWTGCQYMTGQIHHSLSLTSGGDLESLTKTRCMI